MVVPLNSSDIFMVYQTQETPPTGVHQQDVEVSLTAD